MLVSLLSRIADLKACKETQTQVFSWEYCKVLTTPFFVEQLGWLLLLNDEILQIHLFLFLTNWHHVRRENNRNISNLSKLGSLRFESLSIFLSSHENTNGNNMSKISYENTLYVMKYTHVYKHSETIEYTE